MSTGMNMPGVLFAERTPLELAYLAVKTVTENRNQTELFMSVHSIYILIPQEDTNINVQFEIYWKLLARDIKSEADLYCVFHEIPQFIHYHSFMHSHH